MTGEVDRGNQMECTDKVHAKTQNDKSVNSISQSRKNASCRSANSPVEKIMFLQRTAGNHAVQRLIKSGALQAKLKIGQPNDIYEQEADRVAEQVMRMPDSVIQRKCAKCDEDEETVLQAKVLPGRGSVTLGQDVPPIVHDVLRSPGQPLDPTTRAFMETRFGHDFSQVRVHADRKAAESAQAVNALAYTVGQDIVFGGRSYAPQTDEGLGILAHELTHAVQQGFGRSSLDRMGLDRPSASSEEREADRVRAEIQSGAGVVEVHERVAPAVARLPGSPAGGCGVCYGYPGNAGTEAHSIIEEAFKTLNPKFQKELLLVPSPTDKNARLDLAMWQIWPDIMAIGEIKPDNLEGIANGESDLRWYAKQLQLMGIEVSRLNLPPPINKLTFPTLADPPCPKYQDLYINSPLNGTYTYWCVPDFAELIGQCPCKKKRRRKPLPKPIRVRQPEGKEVKEKDKKQKREWRPGPEVLVPVGFALLGAAVKWAGKKVFSRILAPATAIAAIVLVANGAEASIGLEGDDALEAMFKMATQKGTPIPDDLKEAIKKDSAIKQILLDGAKSGNVTEAQRKLGEHLTRIIVENRDQFSEEEIQELLSVSEKNRDVIPNGEVTVEVLRQSLEAAKARGCKATGGVSAEPGKPVPKAAEPTTPATEAKPPTKLEVGAGLEGPTRRLVEGLVITSGKGPKVDETSMKQLHEFVRNVKPPLTDELVNEVLKRVGPATEGETIEEIIASLQAAITSIRAGKAEGGETPSTEALEPEGGEKPKKAAPSVSTNEAIKAAQKPGAKEDKRLAALMETKMGWVPPGITFISGSKDIVFEDGKPFRASIYGRDSSGKLFFGNGGNVTPRKIGGSWQLMVPAGIKLNGASGLYGVTNNFSAPAFSGAGEGK